MNILSYHQLFLQNQEISMVLITYKLILKINVGTTEVIKTIEKIQKIQQSGQVYK